MSAAPLRTELLAKPPSKLKMVECKAILGCKESEWIEIGSAVLTLSTSRRFVDKAVTGDHERV